MERKKSKQTILFPTFIDMDKFLGPEDTRKAHKKSDSKGSQNLYELRGVLLHKGTSAYHGHYEAQVFDVQCAIYCFLATSSRLTAVVYSNQSWFQFNDETVTKIASLVPKIETGRKGGKTAKEGKK